MRSLSPRLVRQIREALLNDSLPRTQILKAIDFALAPRKSAAPAKKRREKKKKARREEIGAIREAVLARDNHECCVCSRSEQVFFDGLNIDHFWGGRGRRRAMQSIETCWALCTYCHYDKTANKPNAAWWLSRFMGHATQHGYSEAASMAGRRLESLQIQGRAS